MRRLFDILWILLCTSYFIVLKWYFFASHWAIFLIGISCILILTLIVKLIDKKRKTKTQEYIFYHLIPKVLYKYGSLNGFLVSLTLMFSLSFLSPILIIYFLERNKLIEFGFELSAYTSLTISSMIITFYGKRFVTLLNKYMVDNPSQKSMSTSEKIVSEDIVKTIFFSLYFFALIISAIIKFKHINLWGFSEEIINPIILAFTTYVALDRIVTTFRRAREIKVIDKGLS